MPERFAASSGISAASNREMAGSPGTTSRRSSKRASRGRWPGRDQVFVLLGATMLPASPPPAPTVRAISLTPDRYEGREVKVVGRFKGKNLYGDLPQALGKGKWDFVLQSAEGALWVTGMRPKGKGFDLDPNARVDTGRWLEVTGVVGRVGSLVYITATALQAANAPTETAVEVAVPERPPLPQPEVIFSAPVDDDHDVERSAPVRIQFSRDVNPKTIRDRVKVSYVASPAAGAAPASTVPRLHRHLQRCGARDRNPFRAAAGALSTGPGRGPRRDHGAGRTAGQAVDAHLYNRQHLGVGHWQLGAGS